MLEVIYSRRSIREYTNEPVSHSIIEKIIDAGRVRTFNCGVGFNVVVAQKDKDMVMRHINQFYNCYEIGLIEEGVHKVVFENRMTWL